MSPADRQAAEKLAKKYNTAFHMLFGMWLGAVMVFWLQAWGPLRSYAEDQFPLPVFPWFLASVAAGLSVRLFPEAYFTIKSPAHTRRLQEALGIRWLRTVITDGDLVTRRVRQSYPGYIVADAFTSWHKRANISRDIERAHLGFLLFGAGASVCALAGGWDITALLICLGNVAVNLLPIFLQRYTRARVELLLERRPVCSQNEAESLG